MDRVLWVRKSRAFLPLPRKPVEKWLVVISKCSRRPGGGLWKFQTRRMGVVPWDAAGRDL